MAIIVLFLNNQVRINYPPNPPYFSMVASALALPSPSLQNQIHELAKTLPPPRKQNIACDACRYAHLSSLHPISLFAAHHRVADHARTPPDRQRKVKCHQVPGQPKVWTSLDVPLSHSI